MAAIYQKDGDDVANQGTGPELVSPQNNQGFE